MSIRVGAKAIIVDNDKILLVEYQDANGLHYNLPGGGVEAGESIKEALAREVTEETCAEVEVGSPAFTYEYEPLRNQNKFGSQAKLYIFFACTLKDKTQVAMPDKPDAHQTAVKWVALSELNDLTLYPQVASYIYLYVDRNPTKYHLEEPVSRPSGILAHLLTDKELDNLSKYIEEDIDREDDWSEFYTDIDLS